MQLGGPVWHASVAPSLPLSRAAVAELAAAALAGVGDPRLGEWAEWTGRAYHLRRRLTTEEAKRVGPVVDVRGTPDATRRIDAVRRWLPPGWLEQIGEA